MAKYRVRDHKKIRPFHIQMTNRNNPKEGDGKEPLMSEYLQRVLSWIFFFNF